MSLFKPAESTSAYLKMGLLGFAGSGKTKTSAITAIGLVLHMREKNIDYAKRPVYFLDTETGSDWVKPDFDRAGIALSTAKTRAFVDLLAAVPDAQANGSLLLIDSISHFWKELCDSYSKKKAAEFKRPTYRLQFQDWGYLKGEWGKFTDLFINSPLHIILAGRAGYEYDYFEEDGKKELEKTGIKMKAEGEMGYEPSLLVLMERHQQLEGGTVTKTWREATVLKDRSTLLDGKVFVDPTFASFLPHIQLLNLGGKQLGVDTSRTSAAIIPAEAPRDRNRIARDTLLDEINDVLLRHDAIGTAAAAQKKRSELLTKHFGTASKTKIEETLTMSDLRAGYNSLHLELEGAPSHYASAIAKDAQPTDINDSLPDHSAPPVRLSSAEQLLNAVQADLGVDYGRVAELAAPPVVPLRDKLLAEIAVLPTDQACANWMLEASTKYDLGEHDRNVINIAIMGRQKSIADIREASKPQNPQKPPRTHSFNGRGGFSLSC